MKYKYNDQLNKVFEFRVETLRAIFDSYDKRIAELEARLAKLEQEGK